MPTILTQEAAVHLVDSAATNSRCDFIEGFISDKNAHQLFYRGLIFGAGDVILEYFAGAALWHAIRTGGQTVPTQVDARRDLFNQYCNIYKSNGGNMVPARSNSYVSFTKHVTVNTAGNHHEHNLGLTFTPQTADQYQTYTASAQQSNFFQKFDQSAYSLNRTPANKVIRGIKKDTSGSNPTVHNLPSIGNLISARQFMTRRACKFLMYEVILDEHGVIHYALDSLTPEHVLNKTALPLEGREATLGNKVPVCTSELRELFRMWNFFRDNTYFYRGFRLVEPMWVTCGPEDKKKWADYAHHVLASEAEVTLARQNSQFSTLGPKYAEFFLAYLNKQYDVAIQRYHDIDYRLFPKSTLKHPSLEPGVFVQDSIVWPPTARETSVFFDELSNSD
ncbi:hypothetical protein B0G84_7515 [Paraburkholderia sp. BL8N3]|nr:hypothetical protein [Paraburkholderia sp. BL8N3]TCK33310.1 hypothetical protein B0G84_7515 [Paraburkholderia sp. BL8N3]